MFQLLTLLHPLITGEIEFPTGGKFFCANPADVRNKSITGRTKAGELTSARHFEESPYLSYIIISSNLQA